jgi:paraquat-inducible protein A
MASEALMPCDTCGLTQRVEDLEPGAVAECIRCGSVMRKRGWGGLEVPAALALAALVLYVPANIYPILSMNLYGNYSENTWCSSRAS